MPSARLAFTAVREAASRYVGKMALSPAKILPKQSTVPFWHSVSPPIFRGSLSSWRCGISQIIVANILSIGV
jgi:hypothetical protein